MRQASRILAFVLIGLIAAAIGANTLLMAQLANTSTVIGTVTDASGAVAPGTAINLRNVDTGLSYQAQTDEAGQFRFLNVPVGRYELSAEKSGFAKTIRSTFDVHPAEPARVDLVLKVGSVAEQVTVSGGNLAVVNTLTANEGNTITGEQVNTLPLTNRVFTQLMGLEPGVSQQVNTAKRIDPNATLLLQTYWPRPTPNYNYQGFNFISEVPDYTRWREESIRIDAKLKNKVNLFGRYTQDSVLLNNPYGLFHENPFPNVGGSTQNFPIYNWSAHLLYAASPTLVTEVSAGMYYANDKSLINGPLSSKSRAPGLTLKEVFPLNELDRIPTMYFGSGYAGIVEQWYFHNDAFSIPIQSETTWIKGKHTFRFGAVYTPEGKSELANPSSNNTNGTYNFFGNFSNNALADFLLGMASNYTETALDPFGKYRWYNLEPYFEDQVKLRNNLTLTAALRYEYFQPEYEQHNMFGAFDPAYFNPATAPTVNPDGSLVPNSGNLLNGIIVGGHNPYPGANSSPYGRALFPSHKTGLAPRVGFSWDPFSNGKMAIRAGYGIFYDRWGSYSQFGAFSPPFNNSVNISNTSLTSPGGAPGTEFPAGLNAPLGERPTFFWTTSPDCSPRLTTQPHRGFCS